MKTKANKGQVLNNRLMENEKYVMYTQWGTIPS